MVLLFDFIDRQFIHNKPPEPTASFKDKVVIVTGGSNGLGKEAARSFVRHGASLVIIACRNVEKGITVADEIRAATSCQDSVLQVWKLDLESYASVISFCERVQAELPRLDVLAANAGIGVLKFKVSEDNEQTITINVVSLFLQACLLWPTLRETAKTHNTYTYITVTASELYEVAKFKERLNATEGHLLDSLNDPKIAVMGDRYNISKLLEVLMVKKLAALHAIPQPDASGVIINCTAPGACYTSLGSDALPLAVMNSYAIHVLKRVLLRPAEIGARTIVHGACAGPESHGQYVPDCKITTNLKGIAGGSEAQKLQDQIWAELSQKLEKIKPGCTAF